MQGNSGTFEKTVKNTKRRPNKIVRVQGKNSRDRRNRREEKREWTAA